jgi:hypothetical protein
MAVEERLSGKAGDRIASARKLARVTNQHEFGELGLHPFETGGSHREISGRFEWSHLAYVR